MQFQQSLGSLQLSIGDAGQADGRQALHQNQVVFRGGELVHDIAFQGIDGLGVQHLDIDVPGGLVDAAHQQSVAARVGAHGDRQAGGVQAVVGGVFRGVQSAGRRQPGQQIGQVFPHAAVQGQSLVGRIIPAGAGGGIVGFGALQGKGSVAGRPFQRGDLVGLCFQNGGHFGGGIGVLGLAGPQQNHGPGHHRQQNAENEQSGVSFFHSLMPFCAAAR